MPAGRPALRPEGKRVRLQITLPPDVAKALDRAARQANESKSETIRRALEAWNRNT